MTTSVHSFAAILFSDIEGYTTMIQQNETQAIDIVNRYQQVLEQVVPKFNGEVKQHYGDGSLTAFDTPSNAVMCAQYLQKELMSSIPIRMGIHCGDVVLHEDKMFGDTVNIASRVESLGLPGTVLFSHEVKKQLQPDIKAISMGHYRLKNVKRKIEVFALATEGLHIPKTGSLKGKLEPSKSFKLPFLIIGLFGIIMLALWLGQIFDNSSDPINTVSEFGSPSIAVLPFENLSPDSSQEYFANGLAQEILILLTQDPNLKVTSQSSSFSFKDQPLGMQEIAQRLQVKYLLEGRVEKSGDSVRVGVQLIDAEQDTSLWGQSWQRELGDIFSVQQEIVDSVTSALDVQVLTERPHTPQQTSSEAYNLFLQAMHVGQQGNVEGLKNAERLLRNVLELDPNYAPAWSSLASTIQRQSNIGLLPMAEGQEQARQAANRALAIDSTLSTPWATLANIAIFYDRDFKKAEHYIYKAREAEPGGLNIIRLASNLYFCLGKIEQAIEMDRRSIEIDPINAKGYFDLGYGYFVYGEFEKAEATARQGMLMNPGHLGGPYLLSLVLMEQGQLEEAKQVALTEPYHILKVHALALIAHSMNWPDTADLYLNEIKSEYASVAPYQIAQAYSQQNQVDSAFKWLQLAYDYGDGGLVQMKSDPFLRSLNNDPRWDHLLSKMAFP